MRKTKIVCTLGPTTDSKEVLRELMKSGMSVARINFSHGNYKDQEGRVNMLKEVREELNLPIPMLLDTKGPEIRIGTFETGEIHLNNGDMFSLVCEDIIGDVAKVGISYTELCEEIEVGRVILINDGAIEIKVEEINGTEIKCRVMHGGKLTNRKSVNIPDFPLNLPSITEKDVEDIKYGIEAGFDYIAASFIRKTEDVEAIRKVLDENGGENIKIISKIENREGVDNFDEILEVCDGIMVARGDLGVEIPMEEVPIYQKQFIRKTYEAGKPVITATQMLESMIINPRPTRAEVSDVANAIHDGTASIMLSGETASGAFPVDCVKVMDRVATSMENSMHYWDRFKRREFAVDCNNYIRNMNYSVCLTAANMKAKAIVTYAETGNSARTISSFGPECPVFVITSDETTYRQLGICWNLHPKLIKGAKGFEQVISRGIELLKKEGHLEEGDIIVISGGGAKIIESIELSQGGINHIMGGVVKI